MILSLSKAGTVSMGGISKFSRWRVSIVQAQQLNDNHARDVCYHGPIRQCRDRCYCGWERTAAAGPTGASVTADACFFDSSDI